MIWLNNVLATPLIGIRLYPKYDKITEFNTSATEIMGKLQQEFDNISITPHEKTLWGYRVKADNYEFNISHNNLSSAYVYNLKTQKNAGGLPTYAYPDIKSYSDLFGKIMDYMYYIIDAIETFDGFSFSRIGIMAIAELDEESMPPGCAEWINHIGIPWNNRLEIVNGNMTATLKENEKELFRERCHHTIKFDKTKSEDTGYALTLDWQRIYDEPKPLETRYMKSQLTQCYERAFEYFETFGEGNLNYE